MPNTRPFHRILVPLEFVPADRELIESGDSVVAGGQDLELPIPVRRSIGLGAQLAAQGGKLRLVHATPSLAFAGIYGGPEGTWMPPGTLKELDEQAQHTSMKIMRDLARRYARDIDVECHAPAGTPTEVILEQADAFDADVIIMATSGRGRARRLFLGSTADKVIRRARCPVLVIPSDVEDAPGWSDDPIPK